MSADFFYNKCITDKFFSAENLENSRGGVNLQQNFNYIDYEEITDSYFSLNGSYIQRRGEEKGI